MKNSALILGVIFCVGSFSSCGSGSSASNNAAGDGQPLSSDQKTAVMNLMSAMNRSQAAPLAIKPARPNGDVAPSGIVTSPAPSPSPSSDPALQSMQSELKNATCDTSWSQTPDDNDPSQPVSAFQKQTDSFKVEGAHCPIAFTDSSTTNSNADSTSSDFDDESSYTVLDKAGFGKFSDVMGWTTSVKLHSTYSKPSNGSQQLTGESGTISGQVISSQIGTVNMSGTITSTLTNGNIHLESRAVLQFPGFQAVLRDETDTSSSGTSQPNEKGYLNGIQLSADEMKRIN
jgi:hypothetical protein